MGRRSNRVGMAFGAAGVALLLLAGAAGAADFPKGTITASQGGMTWSIRFDGEGRFAVSRDDDVMVEGKYKATKEEIELTDEKGPVADPEGRPGKYTWKLEGKKLTFTKVKDESEGRARALTTGDWLLKD